MADTIANKLATSIQTVSEKLQNQDQQNSQTVQKEILASLYDLRDTIQEDIKEVDKVNYRVNFMQKKLHQMMFDDQEKEALRTENAKLKYRIEFLLKYINDNKKE